MTTAYSDSVTTERLVLRTPVVGDAPGVASLISPDVSRWLVSWPPFVDPPEAARRIVDAQGEIQKRRALHWIVELRSTSQVMGWVRITRTDTDAHRGELGLWLGSEFHGAGYATEAVRAVVPIGFDRLGVGVIEAGAQPTNQTSVRVLQRVGMVPSGDRQVWADARQRFERCVYYEIERRSWVGGTA